LVNIKHSGMNIGSAIGKHHERGIIPYRD